MIGPFEVVWSDGATADWMALTFGDAEAVARAVRRFAGGGGTIFVEGEYRLFVGRDAAMKRAAELLHVPFVRH
jgi:hypothetical protein